MEIRTRSVDDVLAIDIEGKLDTTTSTPALENLIGHLDGNPNKVLINLAPLDFVSSAGLRVILRVAKNVRGYKGQMKVCGAQGVVKEVLEISGFDSLLDLYDDEKIALDAYV